MLWGRSIRHYPSHVYLLRYEYASSEDRVAFRHGRKHHRESHGKRVCTIPGDLHCRLDRVETVLPDRHFSLRYNTQRMQLGPRLPTRVLLLLCPCRDEIKRGLYAFSCSPYPCGERRIASFPHRHRNRFPLRPKTAIIQVINPLENRQFWNVKNGRIPHVPMVIAETYRRCILIFRAIGKSLRFCIHRGKVSQ